MRKHGKRPLGCPLIGPIFSLSFERDWAGEKVRINNPLFFAMRLSHLGYGTGTNEKEDAGWMSHVSRSGAGTSGTRTGGSWSWCRDKGHCDLPVLVGFVAALSILAYPQPGKRHASQPISVRSSYSHSSGERHNGQIALMVCFLSYLFSTSSNRLYEC